MTQSKIPYRSEKRKYLLFLNKLENWCKIVQAVPTCKNGVKYQNIYYCLTGHVMSSSAIPSAISHIRLRYLNSFRCKHVAAKPREEGRTGVHFSWRRDCFPQDCLFSRQKWYFNTELWPSWENESKSFYISNRTGQAQHLLSALNSEKFHIS